MFPDFHLFGPRTALAVLKGVCPNPKIHRMSTSIETLCRHAAKTLPDSLSERKTILRAMQKVLKCEEAVYRDVQAQLAAIAAVEKLNAQLQMRFTVSGGDQ